MCNSSPNVDFQNLPTEKHTPSFQIDKCALRQSKRLIKFKTAEPREVDLNPVASGDIFRLCLVSFRRLPVSHCHPLQFRFMEISTNRNLCQAWQTALMRSTSCMCVCKSLSTLSVVVIVVRPRHCSSSAWFWTSFCLCARLCVFVSRGGGDCGRENKMH